jgi:RES domain
VTTELWLELDGSSRLRRLELRAWRVVESQSMISTRKLVDSLEEQALLEELVDRVKPPLPAWPKLKGLHFLLSTPFRHPPLRNGSRFGTRFEPGIWYGSRGLGTAFAEVAYYRLVFLEGTTAKLTAIQVELSAFRAEVRTLRGVDLTKPPFDAHVGAISSKTHYDVSQALGLAMRASGVEVFVYESARDRERGSNVGLFVPAFAAKTPSLPESWLCRAERQRVEITKKDLLKRRQLVFARAEFLVDGKLPSPAL